MAVSRNWKNLRDCIRKTYNREVNEWFRDVSDPIPDNSTPRKQLKRACLILPTDGQSITSIKMNFFRHSIQQIHLWDTAYGVPIEDHQEKVTFRPQIHLFFQQDMSAVTPGKRAIRGEIRQTWSFDKGTELAGNFGSIQSHPFYLPLNKVTVLTLNNTIPQSFRLRYHAPKWFKDFTVYIWRFTGIPRNFAKDTLFDVGNKLNTGTFNNPDSIPSLLANQQALIEALQEQLNDIEDLLIEPSSSNAAIREDITALNQNVTQIVTQTNQNLENLTDNLSNVLRSEVSPEVLEPPINPATIDEEFI